jgi:hypothetical protein
MFLIYDVFPKLGYFVCIYVTPMFTTYFNCFSFRIGLVNVAGFHFFAKLIITNKHPLIIPTLLTYVLVISLLLVDDAEFSPSFLAAYSLTMINILTYLERGNKIIYDIQSRYSDIHSILLEGTIKRSGLSTGSKRSDLKSN